ncbi:DBH-like monooxygenase [Quillaja saponaria]|uniref:DBH-like monooxygenase n=1 Tax=Quillaja saponaria TaxID=32244 RepID=A0AAD7Q2I3_QUISA|nr:DBH-like monooxygenase [Quillaja saponaria]
MAGYVTGKMKMKRKGLDEVSDDFSDFSLSSPARKIRRLDAELPPIMEEEEPEIPLVYHQPLPEEQVSGRVGGPVIEELPSVPANQERAIILFKPVNVAPLQSPSNFSVSVDSNIISGIKDQYFWSSHGRVKPAEKEASSEDANNDSWAVVPWVPSQFLPTPSTEVTQMEPEGMGEALMDIEESIDQPTCDGITTGIQGLHQWQQQHCMIPQLPQNTSTPITWFR